MCLWRSTLAGQARRITTLSLLGAALVLGLLGLLLTWWTVEFVAANVQVDCFSARPYEASPAGECGEGEFDDVLATQTTVTGVFLTLALLMIAGAGLILLLEMLRGTASSWLPTALAGAAAVVGLTTTVFAAVAWPGAWEDEMLEAEPRSSDFFSAVEPSWWGKEDVVGEGFIADFSPGAGWFLAIIGYVILPVVFFVARHLPMVLLAGDAGPPPTRYLAPPPTAPPLPPPPLHPVPPSLQPDKKGVTSHVKRRRIAVVSQQKTSRGTKR